MAEASIPVDLFNPGQVFACLGLLEAAEVLLGDAEGAFDWDDDGGAKFQVSAGDTHDPIEAVLEFLAGAEPRRWGPLGYKDPPPSKKESVADDDDAADDETEQCDSVISQAGEAGLELEPCFPSGSGDRMALPIRFGGEHGPMVNLSHWADGSSRNSFKLYAGNRSADRIAKAMLRGVRQKPNKRQISDGRLGDLKFKGLSQLWDQDQAELMRRPFDVLTPMGGSFNFDPRGAWTSIDAGYSPNAHKDAIQASPVVEFLAGCLPGIPARRFQFELDLSGKNKVVTFAREEHDS